MTSTCTHTKSIVETVAPRTPNGCEECLLSGDTWVSLRMCMTCGHIGCCDSSKNKHARKHFAETNHPIIRAYQPENNWSWCYIDDMYL